MGAGTHSALVAEVSMANGVPKVHKITAVIDCGIVVHPDQANAQIESGILLGFSSGMKNAITFKDGRRNSATSTPTPCCA